ncbi:hypothetical protein LJC27_00610 [Christensenellaceae bacterium OttesenSCG-928-M15]|nr:hypothetical protein [Christensenellaceae bacterium OttesenSCG-928-M15]
MKGKARLRFVILAALMLTMMGALIMQLARLTLTEGEAYVAQADSRSTKEILSTGARGRILDRNGIPLAYDETSYDVQFMRDPERRTELSAVYTEALIEAVKIIEAGGGAVIDTFYIVPDGMGSYVYDFGVTSETAIEQRYKNFCAAMSFTKPEEWRDAAKAYNYLRRSWNIPEEMSYEQACKIMSIRQEVNMNQWMSYQPITIAYNVSMEVVAQLEMRGDELPGISTQQSTKRVYPWGGTAAHIIGYLSRQVRPEATESYLYSRGYEPEDYEGIEGIYKTDDNGVLLAHTDNEKSRVIQMQKMGYTTNDYIGMAGVEQTMEKYLTASTNEQRGKRVVETNMSGVVMRELDKTSASNGSDVMLTIDLPLQQVVEQALEKAITNIAEKEQENIEKNEEDYLNKRGDLEKIKTANSGSIVVLDAKNGQLLAMASNPSYDPNIFVKGFLSTDDYELLYGEDANMPVLNRAIASRLAPGSIFKLSTGLAGLMEGVITPTTQISDGYVTKLNADGTIGQNLNERTEQGKYTHFLGSDKPISVREASGCWQRNKSKHAHLDLAKAIGQSCNYYFFTVADGIGIERLNYWSSRLGLNTSTNIELPGELTSHIGGQGILYDNTLDIGDQKSSLPRYIYRVLQEDLKKILRSADREADDDAVKRAATRILKLQGGPSVSQEFGENIRQILREELGIPVNISMGQNWSNELSSRLTELLWKPSLTIGSGIGQGVALVTPVAIARYAAAFANGGTVYDVHVVDRIIDEDGSVVKVIEPTVHDTLSEVPDEYWRAIQDGLGQVTSEEDGGTAVDAFTTEFLQKYSSKLWSKSGTAQISAQANNIEVENTSWFITMLPREDPEIVIVTCIPNGMSGAGASGPAIEDIVRFYIDRKEGAAQDNLVQVNGITP